MRINDRLVDTERMTAGKAFKDLAMNFCIGFTIFMLLSMVFGMIFADESAKAGIMICWELAGIMLAAVALQLIFFTPILIKRMSYAPRVASFATIFFILLAAIAAAAQWFPADNIGAWIGFTVTYLLILAIMTIVFTIIHRRDVKALDEGLTDFKNRM